jgi:hypothetical protein
MFDFGGFGLLYFAWIILLESARHRSSCPIIGHGSEVILNAFQAAFGGSIFGRKILSSEKPVFIYSVGRLYVELCRVMRYSSYYLIDSQEKRAVFVAELGPN